MNASLLFVFGKPGAGKSYIAQLLSDSLGYYAYDGDTDIPPDMRDALFHKDDITDTMRTKFVGAMITSIKKLSMQYPNIVVHQTLLKEYMRKRIRRSFPGAHFLLVVTEDPIREKRYMSRSYFNLGLRYLRQMSSLFEDVQIPHTILNNTKNGPTDIIRFIDTLPRS